MSGYQFGGANTSNVAPFGSTTTPNASFNFKAPAFGTPNAAGTNFGAPSTTAFGTGNLPFGTTPNPVSAANTSGGLFGTPAPTSTPAVNLFGTPTTFASNVGSSFAKPAGSSATTSTLFGTPTITSTTAGTNVFGSGTLPATGLFSASTPAAQSTISSSPSFPFGTQSTNTAPKLGCFVAPSTAATVAPGLNFGGPTSIPAFSFGNSTTTTTSNQAIPSTGLSFGLGGTTSFNLTPKPPTSANVGLGGIASVPEKSGAATTGKTELLPKAQQLPNELQQTVQNFKEFVKNQKNYSSDVARCSVKEFKKVGSELDLVSGLLNDVEKQLQNNRAVAEKLKHDTAKVLQNVEIAQRTYDTPPGLQYDNTSPLNFFIELVDTFERDMYALKMQIDNTDKYVKNLGKQNPLTSQDLTNGMRKLHETFVALAGRLQSVHGEVQTQKEQYLNLRKYMFKDETNVFEKSLPQNELLSIQNISVLQPRLAAGPTPFNSFMNSSVVHQIQAQNPPPSYANPNQIGFNATTTGAFGVQSQGTTSLIGNTASFGQSGGTLFGTTNASNSFQLQKPPIGSKRKQ